VTDLITTLGEMTKTQEERFAVALTAKSLAAVGGGIGATGARGQSNEVLQSTATTNSGA